MFRIFEHSLYRLFNSNQLKMNTVQTFNFLQCEDVVFEIEIRPEY